MAQEDLWVYEALLRIIENTNQGYTSYYNAPVKEIDALQIGADASKAWLQSENSLSKADNPNAAAAAAAAAERLPARGAGKATTRPSDSRPTAT